MGWKQGASSDAQVIREWWDRWPWANIGVHLGESGLLVIDLDQRADPDTGQIRDGADNLDVWLSEAGLAGLESIESRTHSGGRHLFLAGTAKNCNSWLPLVDIKSAGGYVVLSPSLGVSGANYQWVTGSGSGALGEAPGVLLDSVNATKSGAGPRDSAGGGSEQGGYDYRLAKEQGPPTGHRDVFFNAYEFQLRKDGVAQGRALALLRAVWEKTPDKESFGWDIVEAKVARMWKQGEGGVAPDEDKAPENVIGLKEWAQAAAAKAAIPPPGGGAMGQASTFQGPGLDGSSGVGYESMVPESVLPRVQGLEMLDGDPGKELSDIGAALRYTQVNLGWHKYTPGMGWYAWDGVYWSPDSEGSRMRSVGWDRFLVWYMAFLESLPGWGDEGIRKRRQDWILKLHNGNAMNRVFKLIQSRREMRIEDPELWNPDPWLLVVRNGTIDLRTGKLRASRPEDMCNMQADVVYVEGVRSQLWENHVAVVAARASGERDLEVEDYLQRWAGYSITGLSTEQQFLMLHGRGNNGKSVLAEALVGMLGTGAGGYGKVGNIKLISAQGSGEHDTIWASLAGKRMVHIDEVPRGKLNEERIKKITGESEITARKISKDEVTFRAQFKTWLAANNLPQIADATDGFWRRCVRLPCDSQIRDEDRVSGFLGVLLRGDNPGSGGGRGRVLADMEGGGGDGSWGRRGDGQGEKSGILNWCLQGVQMYLDRGIKSDIPARALWASAEYRREEDQLGSWLDDAFCGEGWGPESPGWDNEAEGGHEWFGKVGVGGVWYPNIVVYKMYEQWCRDRGEKPDLSNRTLPAKLVERGWVRDQRARRVQCFSVTTGMSKGIWGPAGIGMPAGELVWSLAGHV